MARMRRMSAGSAVQRISTRVLPWRRVVLVRVDRRRKRMTERRRSPSTIRKVMRAAQKMGCIRSVVRWGGMDGCVVADMAGPQGARIRVFPMRKQRRRSRGSSLRWSGMEPPARREWVSALLLVATRVAAMGWVALALECCALQVEALVLLRVRV